MVICTPLLNNSCYIIRAAVFCCPCRYSPNLSKRTTHLVTPEVVSNPTEKLTAAAGGQGQQRFKALQVVSKCWVSASAGLRCRACETQFAPLLPPPSAAASTVVSAALSSCQMSCGCNNRCTWMHNTTLASKQRGSLITNAA
jgi:hypothetical protein